MFDLVCEMIWSCDLKLVERIYAVVNFCSLTHFQVGNGENNWIWMGW